MKKILIAVDGSEDSDKAISHGSKLAKGMDSEVVVVTVERPLESILTVFDYILKKMAPEDEKELREKYESIGRDLLNQAEKFLEKEGVTKCKTIVKEGQPAEEILKVAEEEKVDLIVIGSRGKGFAKTVFGSVGREVAMQPKFPVLVARQKRISGIFEIFRKSIREGFPEEVILLEAEEEDYDLIIVRASKRRGLMANLPGSLSYHIVRESPASVLVLKD